MGKGWDGGEQGKEYGLLAEPSASLLLAQKRGTREKGAPLDVPARNFVGYPVLLAVTGVCGTHEPVTHVETSA